MNPGLLLIVGAAAVKIVSVGWLVSIATSPVAIASRKRFLEANKEGLENIVKLGIGPNAEDLKALRKDFKLLQARVDTGWGETHLFFAALRVSNWKFWEHTAGAIKGACELSTNMAGSGLDSLSRGFDWITTPGKPTGNPDGNIRT